jgi:hypothetical protein
MSRPLFVSGTARGGTNLAILIASVHPQVALVQDPYLALLKSFRNALVRARGAEYGVVEGSFDLSSPLDEYYYYDQKLAVMRLLQEASFDLPISQEEVLAVQRVMPERMKLTAPLMVPFAPTISGETYAEMMTRGIEVIGLARRKPQAAWIGFNDNWAIEFFGPLARTFPEARFLAVVRDGRSAVASHVRILEAQHRNPLYTYKKDPAMVAMTLSFVRCWRKQLAFVRHYQRTLGDRLYVLSYERLVQDPETETRRLCAFLDIDYRPAMIDARNFIAGDGNVWLPNSNHEGAPEGVIYSSTVRRWKQTMPEDMADLCEFVAGPDLAMAGYELTREFAGRFPWAALERHRTEVEGWIGGGFGWRTDNRNPDLDFAHELMRRAALASPTTDTSVIERLFLFPEVYDDLREQRPLLP